MPVYSYKAKDSGGGYKTGRVEAPTEADAIDEISRMGLLPVSLEQGSGMPGLSFNLDFKELLHGRVGLPELVMLCRQMYSLSKAGVPIIRAIGGLADSTDHLHDGSPEQSCGRVLLPLRPGEQKRRMLSGGQDNRCRPASQQKHGIPSTV